MRFAVTIMTDIRRSLACSQRRRWLAFGLPRSKSRTRRFCSLVWRGRLGGWFAARESACVRVEQGFSSSTGVGAAWLCFSALSLARLHGRLLLIVTYLCNSAENAVTFASPPVTGSFYHSNASPDASGICPVRVTPVHFQLIGKCAPGERKTLLLFVSPASICLP